MKNTLFITLCLLVLSFSSAWATVYEVNKKSALDIHESPSTTSPVIDVYTDGDRVSVDTIIGKWATVQYGDIQAYVLAEYLKPPTTDEELEEIYAANLAKSEDKAESSPWVHYGRYLLLLIIPALIYCIIRVQDFNMPNPPFTVIRTFMFSALVLSVLELLYAVIVRDITWFCFEPAWYFMVINIVLFVIFSVLQFVIYIRYLSELSDSNLEYGLFSWPIAMVVTMILSLFDIPGYSGIIVLVLLQIVQTVIIFRVMKSHGLSFAVWASLTYVLFTVASSLLLFRFMIVIAIVALGAILFVLFGFAARLVTGMGGILPQSKSSDVHREPRHTIEGNNAQYDGFGEWHDDKGNRYRNTGAWGGDEVEKIED